jgi:hypothetical protein
MKKLIVWSECPLKNFREQYRLTELRLARLAQLRAVAVHRAYQAILIIERGNYSANLFDLISLAFQKLGYDPKRMKAELEKWIGGGEND